MTLQTSNPSLDPTASEPTDLWIDARPGTVPSLSPPKGFFLYKKKPNEGGYYKRLLGGLEAHCRCPSRTKSFCLSSYILSHISYVSIKTANAR